LSLLKKVVFLDRDGVINYDSLEYIKNLNEFILIPGSISAISKLSQQGYAVFVITNQSAIARKLADITIINDIHRYLKKSVQNAGGHINGIYFCPHHPSQGCSCRKPRTGLIDQAVVENCIDVGSAVMVGDKLTDIECAKRAGCKHAYLVMTGLVNPLKEDKNDLFQNFYQNAKTLFHAVDLLIYEHKTKSR
jgi:D-glycero-D-manno-heptose 1,7-bisphosphate phosphatase